MSPENHVTCGDEHAVDCPACGEELCLVDWRIGGRLVIGQRDKCPSCDVEFEICDLDWDVTISLQKGADKEVSHG